MLHIHIKGIIFEIIHCKLFISFLSFLFFTIPFFHHFFTLCFFWRPSESGALGDRLARLVHEPALSGYTCIMDLITSTRMANILVGK